jgi:5-methylcytosine-specific restriction protein A
MPVRPRSYLQRMREAGLIATPDQHRQQTGPWHYGHRWRKLRLMILNRQPICGDCKRAPATEVDHIIALAKGGTDAEENLQGLCARCHSRKTVREDGGLKRRAYHAPDGAPPSVSA